MCRWISWFDPTATIVSPLTAIACASGRASSTVTIFPPRSTRSADLAAAGGWVAALVAACGVCARVAAIHPAEASSAAAAATRFDGFIALSGG